LFSVLRKNNQREKKPRKSAQTRRVVPQDDTFMSQVHLRVFRCPKYKFNFTIKKNTGLRKSASERQVQTLQNVNRDGCFHAVGRRWCSRVLLSCSGTPEL